jgi:hypothetical protein
MSSAKWYRYNLGVSREQWNEVQETCEELDIPVADFMRRSLKLGRLAAELEKNPGDGLIARKQGKDKKIKAFPRRHEDDETLFLS